MLSVLMVVKYRCLTRWLTGIVCESILDVCLLSGDRSVLAMMQPRFDSRDCLVRRLWGHSVGQMVFSGWSHTYFTASGSVEEISSSSRWPLTVTTHQSPDWTWPQGHFSRWPLVTTASKLWTTQLKFQETFFTHSLKNSDSFKQP